MHATRLITKVIQNCKVSAQLTRAYAAPRREKVFVNEVRLLGRVGTDPELRGSGHTQIATFPLATASFWKNNQGEEQEKTDWHRIATGIPSTRDYVMNNVVKGDRILIFGSIQYSEYTDENQVRRNTTSIFASRILNLTNLKASSARAEAKEEEESSY